MLFALIAEVGIAEVVVARVHHLYNYVPDVTDFHRRCET